MTVWFLLEVNRTCCSGIRRVWSRHYLYQLNRALNPNQLLHQKNALRQIASNRVILINIVACHKHGRHTVPVVLICLARWPLQSLVTLHRTVPGV